MGLFTVLTILTLIGFAIAHALGLLLGVPIEIANAPLPRWASQLEIAVFVLLSLGLWWESRSRQPSVGARKPGRGGLESMDESRQPPAYFLFSSNGVSVKEIRDAAAKYGHIMVGFDAGNVPPASLKAAKDVGAELSIYVEGPGGPTGSSWAPDERARVKAAARSVGVDVGGNTWMEEWDKHGWKAYTFRQLEEYLKQGYTACEIDNLDRTIGRSGKATVAFFREFAALQSAGKLPRLIMKNMSEEQLDAVVDAVKTGALPRSMFAEFHISEKGTGNRKLQDDLSCKIGIRTLASNDTFNYDAKGVYGLDKQFAALMSAPVAPAQPAATVTPPQTVSPAAPQPVVQGNGGNAAQQKDTQQDA